MYKEMYDRWLAADLADADLKPELESVKDDDAAIQDRFAVALKFGTAGLRGVIGAGTNRMNIYVVRQATQGLANWVKTQGGSQTVAISYDSRIKSDVFAKTAAEVLAANGIKVRIYSALMPVPALSFATRYYNCNAGIMVTASHNPAKYNGYKAYGPDGCQMTDEAADIVYAEIQKTDILTGAKLISFEDGMAQGLIEYVGDDCINALYAAIEARSIRPGICKTAGLKLVYSPLNGSGLVPVTHVLKDIGITDITVVPEQEKPDGNFPTCPYPNPEIREAMQKGIDMCEQVHPDLLLATDPDADRVGVACKAGDDYQLITGNEMGVMLLDYICKMRAERGEDLTDKVAVTTIVSSAMVDALAAEYGFELRRCLTGFKYIGDIITGLADEGHVERFIFGFEESYGYLTGDHVRDKDAVNASLLICQMAQYYKLQGKNLADAIHDLYEKYGYYHNKTIALAYPGADGHAKMAGIMAALREEAPQEIAGSKVEAVVDYNEGVSGLPKANVLEFDLEDGNKAIVRPSGTEPKIKLYIFAKGEDAAAADALLAKIEEDGRKLLS